MAKRPAPRRDAVAEYAAIVAADPHPRDPRGRRVPKKELAEAAREYSALPGERPRR